MRYPPQFLDTIRQHFRISEVIGQRMPIKRHGREFVGCCPFHKEKTPSFTVNDEKGFYHCFGCHAHGDVITFVKEQDNLSFADAVETLANMGGIPLPQLTQQQQKQLDKNDQFIAVMELASKWFVEQLQRSSGAAARSYLEGRGMHKATLDKFHVGFAPSDRQGLKHYLQQKNIQESMMLELGLLTKPDSGESYDKFRGRIIFPINNSAGKVIAFGGRLMAKESKAPKYLNSPDTPLFKKSYILYNADKARKAAGKTKRIIVAEGYMDVIALSQAGFEAAVAPLGTAVTTEQLNMLWQMVDTPTLCLDGDNAGNRAMLRAADLAIPLLKPGKSLEFCQLPEGSDPDSLIQEHGVQSMREQLNRTIPLVDIVWTHHYASHDLSTPEKRAGAEQELFKTLERIADTTIRGHYDKEMKQRIWQAGKRSNTQNNQRSQKGSGSSANRGGKNNWQKNQQQNPVVNINTKNISSPQQNPQLEECFQAQISIFLLYPSLLMNAEMEQLLLNTSPRSPDLHGLCQDIIEYILPADSPKREMVSAMLPAGKSRDLAKTLLEKARKDMNLNRLAGTAEPDGLIDAQQFLAMLQDRQQQISLSNEYQHAHQLLSSVTDENDPLLARFLQVHEENTARYVRDDYFGKES